MTASQETFGVYCTGETLDGTDISMLFISVTTPLGQVRMTTEEAEHLGRSLIAAADYNRQLEEEDA